MLSRVADSIYWMSRYVERAENLARFVDVTLSLMLDTSDGAGDPWRSLVYTTGDHEWFEKKYQIANQANVIQFIAFDREYPNSIISCLRAARENARTIRETISSEMWEHVNQFYYQIRDAGREGHQLDSPSDFFHHIKLSSHTFNGVADVTMSHNEGWHFAQIGRLLERADKTSRILDVKYFLLLPSIHDVGTPTDDLQWSSVLRSVSALEMFRKRHHRITPSRVVDFLVLDREFPRAVHHCIATADESLHAISGTPAGWFRNTAEQRTGQLRAELTFASVDEIIAGGLHDFLDVLQDKINRVGEAVYETFVAMRPVETPSQTQSQRQG